MLPAAGRRPTAGPATLALCGLCVRSSPRSLPPPLTSLSLRYSCVAGMAVGGPPGSGGSHMSSHTPDRGASKIVDLEVKDARVIFTAAWEGLEEEVGREHLRFPKEIILLGGAPGAGKGTHTR